MTDAHVRAILSEIGERPPAQWQALLEKRFPDDAALVQQALLWLHSARDGDDESERPTLGPDGDTRYELAVELDHGATASVWQAYDRKLGRNVAIKILHAEDVEQVVAEARTACDVISDHVVRILDAHGGEHPYIVMELIAEHDPERGDVALGTAASECTPRDVREVAAWVLGVARGVHDAHLRGVVHRDLKPRNVLITPISRRARIADFGLAVSAQTDPAETAGTPLIRTGPSGAVSVQGTPEYMAPEQARGLPLELDPRTARDRAVLVAIDVWGLGALAYALLAGRGPWGPRGSGLAAWERASSGEQPPPLDRAHWGERVPVRLRRIIAKAMALDASARYASAAQLANELEAFLARRPTSFDRGRRARLALWCRRNPQLTLTAVVAVALVLLTLVTRVTLSHLRDERDALRGELAEQETEQQQLDHQVQQNRAALVSTRKDLAEASHDLESLQKDIEEERKLQATVLQAKDKDLRAAARATRQLVEELEQARAEIHATEAQRAVAESSLKAALRDLERVTKERDRARQDRDVAHGERDVLARERDAAIAERDAARSALSKLQEDLARAR